MKVTVRYILSTVFGVGLVAVVFAANVQAQQAPFTFDVAVDVKEMHRQVTDLHVRCAVYGQVNGKTLGRGDARQKLINRAFKGSVKVAVQMLADNSPTKALRYACRLRLIVAGGAPSKPAATSNKISLRPKPGAAFGDLITGNL